MIISELCVCVCGKCFSFLVRSFQGGGLFLRNHVYLKVCVRESVHAMRPGPPPIPPEHVGHLSIFAAHVLF